jgi:serine protease Do
MSHLRILAALTALTLAGAAASPAAARPLDADQISDVAEAVVESVVNVSSEREVALDFGPFAHDPFFNDPRSPWYVDPQQRKRRQQAAGSGVIVTERGRILTNAHVVQGAERVKVTLADGTELDGKVIGIDKPSDLAVIQLEGDVPRLRALKLGSSARLRLGEVVLAVGNPFGVGQSVTMGIVSAKGRGSLGLVDYEDFIQTDAAINPGNSGGALVNLRGELVGINTAIASAGRGYDGIGFAIPSDMAAPIMKMLVEDGKVARGYIGVSLAPLTRQWIEQQQVATRRGVLVASVVAGSPASRAGLQEGDVVVAVDGTQVATVPQLRNYIAMKGAGRTVELELVRGKQTERLSVRTGELPSPGPAKPAGQGAPAGKGTPTRKRR